MFSIIEDALLDSVKLVPFLFLAYLGMEYLEHRTGAGIQRWIKNCDRGAPVVGGLLGVIPQCGFSAAASNLYAGNVITQGTLMAIYLSTSDEMLPILLSEGAPAASVAGILALKAGIGIAAGLAIDWGLRRKGKKVQKGIHDMCRQEHCHCEDGIFRSALLHTAKILFFIFIVTLLLNTALYYLGEEALAGLILDRPVLGPVLAGVVGLIPNCAGSVVITQLYLRGAMGLGAAMAGLLAGSGVGVLVLFRVNRDRRENLKILAQLYGLGVGAGILISMAEKLL